MNLKYNFAIQSGSDREELAVIDFCIRYNHSFRKFTNPLDIPADFIPVGSVEYVQATLSDIVTPNYYPEFLSEYLNRKVWYSDEWPEKGNLFIKPADRFKRFEAFIKRKENSNIGRKNPPFYISEVVKFENEFRLYVSNGQVLTAGYVFLDEIPTIPDINWPKDFHGAVDFGMVSDKLTLVEVNAPFACGWYGPSKENHKYIQWLIEGYGWLKANYQ